MHEKERPVRDDPAFQAAVLSACRRLIAAGRYPSGQLLAIEMPGRGQETILAARARLVASGRLAITIPPPRPGPAKGRRPATYGNRGLGVAQADQVADRARQILMLRLRKNWRGESPELSQEELDQVLPPVECRRTEGRRKGEHHAQ